MKLSEQYFSILLIWSNEPIREEKYEKYLFKKIFISHITTESVIAKTENVGLKTITFYNENCTTRRYYITSRIPTFLKKYIYIYIFLK